MSLTPSSNSFNNNTTAISFPFPSPSPTYNYTNIYIKSGDICEFEAAQGKSFNYWYFGVLHWVGSLGLVPRVCGFRFGVLDWYSGSWVGFSAG